MKKKLIIGFSIIAVISIILLMLFSASFLFTIFLGVEVQITPFTSIQYLRAYPDVLEVKRSFFLSLAATIAVPLILIVTVVILLRKKRELYGKAKLADNKELTKKGVLLKKNNVNNGVIIGRIKKTIFAPFEYLYFKGAQFILLVAPTRSGKGVGYVIPNLLTYINSVVVLDIKQENWDLTSRYRKEGLNNECFMFSPLAKDFKTHRYNPLDYISENPVFRVNDVMKIALMLYPRPDKGDDIFQSTARDLFIGITLMLIETKKELNIGNVFDQASVGDGQKYLKEIIDKQIAIGEPLSHDCVSALNSYVSMASENTRSGCIGNFRTALTLWRNPLVRAATSKSDFNFNDLRKKKMSIYVVATPNNIDDLQPLINLFFQQLIDENLEELPEQNPEIKHDVLLLMDEFTSIGRIPVLMKGVAYIAGYGLRLSPIIQNINQLKGVYGDKEAENFIQNMACYIVFPPSKKDTESAKQLSEAMGYETVKSQSRNLKKRSEGSENDHQRALFLPQEITSLGEEKEIVIIDNMNPIIASKVRYFNDPFFLEKFSRLSGKELSGFDIKNLAEKGVFSVSVPMLNITGNSDNEKSKGTSLNKDVQEFLRSNNAILNAFRLKDMVSNKFKDLVINDGDKKALNGYIDDKINTLLYTNELII